MIQLKLTSIQLHEETKKKLESKKIHHRESYESVINRVLESDDVPSMEDMFKMGSNIKQKRKYSTKEIIGLTHRLRRQI